MNMKKIIMLSLLAVLTVVGAKAQTGGVNFQEGTLKELLAKADAQKKYLFVDVYATWCGPCKYMAKSVFPQKSMGDYFNATFVNATFDAEKGEGIEIAKTYGVQAYPTFLILDASGKEVGRIVGGDEADGFIQKTKEVVANIK